MAAVRSAPMISCEETSLSCAAPTAHRNANSAHWSSTSVSDASDATHLRFLPRFGMRSATHRQRWGTRGPTLSWVSRCAPAACGEGVTLRSPCPCCWRCSTTHLPLLALLHPHTPSCSVRSVRARARRAHRCIEALKPALQNGGQRLQGFNAESSIYNSSIVSAKLRICQVQGGNSGVRYWYYVPYQYRYRTGTVRNWYRYRYGTT